MRLIQRMILVAAMGLLTTSAAYAQGVSSVPGSGNQHTSVGVTEDETQIKATAGVLLSISAWNKSTSADAFIKCTNATAANTTPGSTTIIYQMLVPYSSGYTEQINMTFSTALTCYMVLSPAAAAVDEVAANEVGWNIRYR